MPVGYWVESQEESFDSIEQAISATARQDTVVINLDEEVFWPPLEIQGKDLIFSAADEKNPVIRTVLPSTKPVPCLTLIDSKIVLSGLEINDRSVLVFEEPLRMFPDSSEFLISQQGGSLTIDSCLIRSQMRGVLATHGELDINDSLIVSVRGTNIGVPSSESARVRCRNSLFNANACLRISDRVDGSVDIEMERCSIAAPIGLRIDTIPELLTSTAGRTPCLKLRITNTILGLMAVSRVYAESDPSVTPSSVSLPDYFTATVAWSREG